MRREYKRHKTFTRRAVLLGGAQMGLFSLLAGRLYYLQVLQSKHYAVLAEDNRVSPRLIPPERGLIFDRFGVPLAVNRQTYRVFIVPEQAPSLEETLDALERVIPASARERERVLRMVRRTRAFTPVTVVDNLSWEDIARVSVHSLELPGVQTDMVPRRLYPQGHFSAHVVGYVGAVAEEDLTGDPLLAVPEFRIGKAGIERVHEADLRGTAGVSEVEVNAVGRVIRELSREEGDAGKDLTLTIDAELQRFATERFEGETGAVVVLDIQTGEVLAMVSSPAYDPNAFDRGITASEWNALLRNELAPLTNKAVSGQYAPGSTFKMVVALAALEHKIVSPQQTFFCGGVLALGDGRFHCWRRGGHGHMNMHDGIVQSCDVYFYEIARRVGIDRIAAMARRLGLGDPLGVELPNERGGLIPTKAWKVGALGKPWLIGETLIAGIGQGFVLATPLQLAVMTARLANGGRAVVPRLTRRVGAEPASAEDAGDLNLSAEWLRLIRAAMNGVTNQRRGTAYGARISEPGMEMGGKTGTSQVRRISTSERRTGVRKAEELEREERDHALFVGYAPVDAPRYAVAVIVEHGGGGSRVAAPIAREILLETQRRDPGRRTAPPPPPQQHPPAAFDADVPPVAAGERT